MLANDGRIAGSYCQHADIIGRTRSGIRGGGARRSPRSTIWCACTFDKSLYGGCPRLNISQSSTPNDQTAPQPSQHRLCAATAQGRWRRRRPWRSNGARNDNGGSGTVRYIQQAATTVGMSATNIKITAIIMIAMPLPHHSRQHRRCSTRSYHSSSPSSPSPRPALSAGISRNGGDDGGNAAFTVRAHSAAHAPSLLEV